MKKEKRPLEEEVVVDEPSAESDSSSDSESDEEWWDTRDDDEADEQLQVEFEGQALKEADFHGVKTLAQQIFHDKGDPPAITSDLADILVGQTQTGSVIRATNSNEHMFGILSVVGLIDHKKRDCVAYLDKTLSKYCPPAHKETLRALIRGERDCAAWIINERIMNMPPQIAPPMMQQLLQEVEWAIEEKDPGHWNFSHYIFLTQVVRAKDVEPREGGSKRRKTGKSRQGGSVDKSEIAYMKYEDEIIREQVVIRPVKKGPYVSLASDARGKVPGRGNLVQPSVCPVQAVAITAQQSVDVSSSGASRVRRLRLCAVIPAEKMPTVVQNMVTALA